MRSNSKSVFRGINLVLGYGKFGRRAVSFLHNSVGQEEHIVVIDRKPHSDVPDEVQFVCADAVEWFAEYDHTAADIRRIIPAVPIHFAAKWLTRKLSQEGWDVKPCPLSDRLLAKLPHSTRISPYRAVTSHADFICPVDCPEPEGMCTYTKQPRPLPIYQLINDLNLQHFAPLVLRSRQFAPGIGGYYPEDLYNLLSRAKHSPNHKLLVGTACKCHGILDGMDVKKQGWAVNLIDNP